jgi:hypothetical protein
MGVRVSRANQHNSRGAACLRPQPEELINYKKHEKHKNYVSLLCHSRESGLVPFSVNPVPVMLRNSNTN